MNRKLAFALEEAAREEFAKYVHCFDDGYVGTYLRRDILRHITKLREKGILIEEDFEGVDMDRLTVERDEMNPHDLRIYFEEDPLPPPPPYRPPPEPPASQIDNWEETMTKAEVDWCWNQIRKVLREEEEADEDGYGFGGCVDSFRAARAWKSSQVRRFKRLRSCCGGHEWVAYRWSWKKLRFDKYILGFNYGH